MIFLATHIILVIFMAFCLGSSMSQLVYFISNQGLLGATGLRYPLLMRKNPADWTEYERQYVLYRLLYDLLLVILLVLQHSLMARDWWKQFLNSCRISVSERLIYVIASCYVLHHMIGRWLSTPDVVLWVIDTEERSLHWLFFFLLHTAAWCILFLQVSVMNPMELIGVKQVVYYHKGIGPPLSYMNKQLRTFYQHLRHAGPTSLCLMLWVHPVMTLDRFLLALTLSFYLATAHRVSLADYHFAYSHFVMRQATTTTTTRHKVR